VSDRLTFRTCQVDGCPFNAHHTAKGSRGYCAKHAHRLRKHGDPLGGRTASGAPASFIAIAVSHQSDECLMWPFARNSAGYGHMKWGSRYQLAHRLVCEAAHGPAPSDKPYCAHTCGKGHLGCCNPRHLRWATPTENAADKVEHGTHLQGEAIGFAKLHESDVVQIRQRYASGETQYRLATSFGVTQTNISNIVRRASWKHVA
jgi:hypothetical protein